MLACITVHGWCSIPSIWTWNSSLESCGTDVVGSCRPFCWCFNVGQLLGPLPKVLSWLFWGILFTHYYVLWFTHYFFITVCLTLVNKIDRLIDWWVHGLVLLWLLGIDAWLYPVSGFHSFVSWPFWCRRDTSPSLSLPRRRERTQNIQRVLDKHFEKKLFSCVAAWVMSFDSNISHLEHLAFMCHLFSTHPPLEFSPV